jgi:hypothetical protein
MPQIVSRGEPIDLGPVEIVVIDTQEETEEESDDSR